MTTRNALGALVFATVVASVGCGGGEDSPTAPATTISM